MCECVIFRHQLFKVSEPFIAQQASHLSNFRPLYLGRSRFGSPPEGAESLALEDLPGWGFRSKVWQAATCDARPYIRLLGGRRPALIHAHFGIDGVYALPLARRLRVPLVTTFHGFDATFSVRALLSSHKPSWVNYVLFRRRLMKEGDLFLCASEYIRKQVLDLGFPEDRTHVHYIGIDTAMIKPRNPQEERPVILHVARLVEKKGTEYLIRAFARIAVKIPDTELMIIGEGPLKEQLQRLAQRLRVYDRVHFLGAQPHDIVMDWMRKAVFLVLPSIRAGTGDAEGLGMVLLEAAATGAPVIGTMHGGIPEVVVDGETGYLVPERSIEALSERIGNLLEDRAGRRRMGARARVLTEERFDIQRQAQKLETFYNNIAR